MKRITEDADVILDLVSAAKNIHHHLAHRFTLGVINTDTDAPVVAVMLVDLDGDGSWIGVTVEDTPAVVWHEKPLSSGAAARRRTPEREAPCGRTVVHPRHKYLLGRYGYQCPGRDEEGPE